MVGDPLGSPRDLEDAAEQFELLRRRLFGIAYRMLGSAVEAEDVVQEVWLRWQRYDRDVVVNPEAFLVTTTTRLAINASQLARVRREAYVGPWLPEPIDTTADPALGAERAEALDLGIMTLLETLTPAERAVYVLREAFDYPFAEIAAVVQTSEVNARQLLSRARKHVASGRRAPVAIDEHRRLLETFLVAAQAGAVDELERLFAEEVVSCSDGGGVAPRASKVPVSGRARVAKFLKSFASTFWTGTTVRWTEANGRPAALVSRDGVLIVLVSASISSDGIDEVFWVMNPAKLVGFAA